MKEPGKLLTHTVTESQQDRRLDQVLAEVLGISRTRVATLIRRGSVELGNKSDPKPSTRLSAGDRISFSEPEQRPGPSRAEPEEIPLDIVFEDEQLLVVDKPAGMVVHPAPGNYRGTLVNALLAHINRGSFERMDTHRPGIVHRLDKDTSGLLVVAKTFRAHESLAAQIKERSAGRKYLAITLGHWPDTEGEIEAPLGRSPSNRKKMAVLDNSGARPALTRYRVLESYPLAELLEVKLSTGRTHQIRVHFAHRGHPVMDDPLYGGRSVLRSFSDRHGPLVRALLDACSRQALHAHRLSFEHPESGRRLEFESGPPADIQRLLRLLREDAGATEPDKAGPK